MTVQSYNCTGTILPLLWIHILILLDMSWVGGVRDFLLPLVLKAIFPLFNSTSSRKGEQQRGEKEMSSENGQAWISKIALLII